MIIFLFNTLLKLFYFRCLGPKVINWVLMLRFRFKSFYLNEMRQQNWCEPFGTNCWLGSYGRGRKYQLSFFSFYNGVRCEYSIFIVNGFNENKTFAKIHQNKKKSNIEGIRLVCTKIFSVFSWYLHFTMKMGQNNGVVINIIFNCVVA